MIHMHTLIRDVKRIQTPVRQEGISIFVSSMVKQRSDLHLLTVPGIRPMADEGAFSYCSAALWSKRLIDLFQWKKVLHD